MKYIIGSLAVGFLMFPYCFAESHVAYVRAKTVEEKIEIQATKLSLNPKLVKKIVNCESKGKQIARGHLAVVGVDIGVFQLNSHFHEVKAKEKGFDIYDEDDNIAYGLWLMKKEGTMPWKSSRLCWNG